MSKQKKPNKHGQPGAFQPEDIQIVKDKLLGDARLWAVLIILITIGIVFGATLQ